MGANEALEHAEHASHAHGSKQMGVTMAILAVLIAFCAAMVGSQRQELMTTLLDQSWAHSSWVAASIRSSMVASDLQKLHGQAGAATNPTLPGLLRLDSDYATETKLAKEWDDACEPLIDAHYDAAEGYEHAQLIAELALIICSVGILLNNRTAWLAALAVGAVCVVFIVWTFISARGEVEENHHKVEHAEKAYDEHTENDLDSKGRDQLLNDLDPGGKIRATFATETKHGEEPSKATPEKHDQAKPQKEKDEDE
ncbi:MAG TPA: DUF4337 family protein [Chthoniobacterales bacterium]|nr:DUF4337 family protein [Chthoniobacterales bacterium]